MPHVFEPAPTGRAKCRGCGQPIVKDDVRFGERVPNPFGEGEATLWFHPECAAYKRPEALLEALPTAPTDVDGRVLEGIAKRSVEHPRRARLDGAERAASGQAACRHCKEKIEKGSWRLRLVFFEEGRFSPGGFVHLACRRDYFQDDDLLPAILRFSPALDDGAREDLRKALAS